MQVEHFNPKLKGKAKHRYSNLMLATGHCNNMKSDTWPTPAQMAQGIRFLNPTKETEYGVVIFEDSATHELVGTTPAARFHIDMLDLNAETFVWERKKRAKYNSLRTGASALLLGSFEELRELLEFVAEQMELMIPPIPAPP